MYLRPARKKSVENKSRLEDSERRTNREEERTKPKEKKKERRREAMQWWRANTSSDEIFPQETREERAEKGWSEKATFGKDSVGEN